MTKFQSVLPEGEGLLVERLGETLRRIDGVPDSTTGSVLREAVRLYQDFIRVGGVGLLAPGEDPSRVDRSDTLVSRVESDDPNRLADAVSLLERSVGVDASDTRKRVMSALNTLDRSISHAFDQRQPGGDPFVVEPEGQKVDARPYRFAWNSRSLMLQETIRAAEFMLEVSAQSEDVMQAVARSADEARVAKEALDEIVGRLAEAHAERAQNELATHFETLARSERLASDVFRGATFVLLIFAAVVGGLIAGTESWQKAVAHGAVVVALGGAAAYTARLGTIHRSTGDWAKSIQVQLKTLRDFLAEIEDTGARERVYEEFGRRVLGSPPSMNGQEVAPLPTSQLLELASVISQATKRG